MGGEACPSERLEARRRHCADRPAQWRNMQSRRGLSTMARLASSCRMSTAQPDRRGGSDLVYFVFDLLYIDGQDLMPLPLSSRKARLAALLERPADAIRYSDHQIGHGQAFHRRACKLGLEG